MRPEPDDRPEESPDGRFRIDYVEQEARMSHWIKAPTVLDLRSGRAGLKLDSGPWDASHHWSGSGRFTLFVRRYPDPTHNLPVHFDVDAATVGLGDGALRPIEEANRLIERHFAERVAALPPAPDAAHRRPRSSGWEVIGGLAIAALFIALVAIGSYMSQR